jgi:hypothetical protein
MTMPDQRIPFPRHHRDLLLTEDDHSFLLRIIGPFQGPEVEDLLQRAVHCTDGRRIVGTDDDLDLLLAAVDIEAHGFLRVESENAGRELRTPKRGGNAERLRRLADQIEDHLS